MYEWIQLHEEVILAAWYGFVAGNVTGLLFMFFQARSIVKKHLRP